MSWTRRSLLIFMTWFLPTASLPVRAGNPIACFDLKDVVATEQPPKPEDAFGADAKLNFHNFTELTGKDILGTNTSNSLVEFYKMMADPWYSPSDGDIKLIRASQNGASLYSLYLATAGVQRILRPATWFAELFMPLGLTNGSNGFDYSQPGWRGWAFRNGNRILQPFTKTIQYIIPFSDRIIGSATTPIFRKLYASRGSYAPTPEEKELLVNYHEFDKYSKAQEKLLKLPMLARFREYAKFTMRAVVGIASILVANNIYQLLSQPDSLQTTVDFVSHNRPDPDEVMIVTETTPFPHNALWIGDKVYSFGTEQLTATNAAVYLLRDTLPPAPDADANIGTIASAKKWLTGSPSFKRSIQVVRLRIGKDQVDQLQRDLELKVQQNYKNVTFVNDCSTMVARSLNMENRFFDAGPGQLLLYFSYLKTIGDERVTGVYQLTNTDPGSHNLFLLRNAVINMTEVSTFARLFVANQANRGRLDFAYQASDLVTDAPGDSNVIDRQTQSIVDEGLRKKLKDMIAHEDQIRLFALKQKRLLSSNQSDPQVQAQLNSLKSQIASYVQAQTDSLNDEINNPSTPFEGLIAARYKLELLKAASASDSGFAMFLDGN